MKSPPSQFAQISKVPVGTGPIEFIFVASLGKGDGNGLPKLTFKYVSCVNFHHISNICFRSLKGISYPGGARFASLSPCELDSLSDECDEESEEDRSAIRGKKMRY